MSALDLVNEDLVDVLLAKVLRLPPFHGERVDPVWLRNIVGTVAADTALIVTGRLTVDDYREQVQP